MLLAWPAQAQMPPCPDRGTVVDHLGRKYAEAPVAMGWSSGGVVEVLTSKDGATWTIIVTAPDGTACLVAAGEAWVVVVPTLGERS